MSAPLRIARHINEGSLEAAPLGAPDDGLKEYVDRLLKLIPAEIVAVYLAGKVQIGGKFPAGVEQAPTGERVAWIVWTLFCLGGLLLVRRWATSDPAAKVPPEWAAVGLTAISFLVWVYSLGDVFQRVLGIWDSLAASLLVLAWTFVAPYLYKPKP